MLRYIALLMSYHPEAVWIKRIIRENEGLEIVYVSKHPFQSLEKLLLTLCFP